MDGHEKAATLLLVRHGESETNAADVFTGWSDPLLTRVGEEQVHAETLHRNRQNYSRCPRNQ